MHRAFSISVILFTHLCCLGAQQEPDIGATKSEAHPLRLDQKCDKEFARTLNDEENVRAYIKGCTNGIEVATIRIYDDAFLNQQLEAARLRLAALNAFDQPPLKIGSINGGTEDSSTVDIRVQSPNLATTLSPPAGGAGTSTPTSGGRPTASTANESSSTLSLPTGFSASASTNLNEELQLQEEIATLSLLLEGSNSDQRFKNVDGDYFPRIRSTIAIPLMINTPYRYKNAVAVIEIAVRSECAQKDKAYDSKRDCKGDSNDLQAQRPTVLTILPREKTYNTVTLTNRNLSASGGVVTGLVGASGGFMKSKKTYFITKDQDTIAGTYLTENDDRWVGIQWFFRPILGRTTVASGPREILAQIAFPYPPDRDVARKPRLGEMVIRTYWCHFDRKTGTVGSEILGSLTNYRDRRFDIPESTMKPSLMKVQHVEDLHTGNALIVLSGNFPSGTFVRLGSKIIRDPASGLQAQPNGLAFTATLQELSQNTPWVLYRDGEEDKVQRMECQLTGKGGISAKYIDESHVQLIFRDNGLSRSEEPMIFVSGGQAYSANRIFVDHVATYIATVPANLETNSLIIFRPLLGREDCSTQLTVSDLQIPRMAQKLIYLGSVNQQFSPERRATAKGQAGRDKQSHTIDVSTLPQASKTLSYLSFDPNLRCAQVLFPKSVQVLTSEGGAFTEADCANSHLDADVTRIDIASIDMGADGATVLLRTHGGKEPFVVELPPPPKSSGQSTEPAAAAKAKDLLAIGEDDATIILPAETKVTAVTFNKTPLSFTQNKNEVKLSGLVASRVTASPGSKSIMVSLGAKQVGVELEVVSSKVEIVAK